MARAVYSRRGIFQDTWLELIVIGSALLILLISILGVVVAILPIEIRQYFALGCIVILVIINTYIFIKNRIFQIHLKAPTAQLILYMGFITLTLLSIFIANLPVKLPQNLADGAYVAKANVLPVRIQYIVGDLPADNSIPHVVSEYLLQNISFKENSPILPGQEVSNRPILMSLVSLPFIASLRAPHQLSGPLPKFSYVGQEWPDFRLLIQDVHSYRISLTVGIILNALMLLSVGVFVSSIFAISAPIALACTLSVVTSPFFLFQTIFIWPKAMAGFFLALSIFLVLRKKDYFLGGLMMGLAYLSHPYAAAFVLGICLLFVFELLIKIMKLDPTLPSFVNLIQGLIIFCISFGVLVVPWLIWIKLIIQLPPSNLIEQNLFIPGQSVINFLWVRVVNFSTTFLPFYWSRYPFDFRQFTLGSSVNAVGACGALIYIFFLKFALSFNVKKSYPELMSIGLPAVFLIFIFSITTVPALHGLQFPIMAMLFLGCVQAFKTLGNAYGGILIYIQCIVNILLLTFYLRNLL
jgi:hypothetical protein